MQRFTMEELASMYFFMSAIPPKTSCLLDKIREKKNMGSQLCLSQAFMVWTWPYGSLVSTATAKNQLPAGFFYWSHPDWPEIGRFMPFLALFYKKNLTLMSISASYKDDNSTFTIITNNYVYACFQHYFKTHYLSVEWELIISLNLVRFVILIKICHILWLLQLWEAAE